MLHRAIDNPLPSVSVSWLITITTTYLTFSSDFGRFVDYVAWPLQILLLLGVGTTVLSVVICLRILNDGSAPARAHAAATIYLGACFIAMATQYFVGWFLFSSFPL